MNIDKEQAAFEKWWEENWNSGMDKEQVLEGWQARTALMPSEEQIEKILSEYYDIEARQNIHATKAIRKLLEDV